ncbi:hypothetical protein J7620_09960 [Wohlfahrtiimonas chitiniclastica]|uniref:hypothetical protein n=1 Tax=Wohlfahrtiimonas chitiniclastica TaxID=400946 RepID=UPI001BCC39C7|nr:hypothetical protein [Wohlfahrtiimonas chitiniclastica]MBS7835267.1 hypothetical protein [Wohlfahrtiimonas chitiniclastica]
MESEKCRYQSVCGFVAAIFVSLVVFVFVFGNAHWETLRHHPVYLIIKDNGSLIAGLIALFAAVYTVREHKKQSKKESLEQERLRALQSLLLIRENVDLLKQHLTKCKRETIFSDLSKDVFPSMHAEILKNALIVKGYFSKKKYNIECKKISLVILNIKLFRKYTYWFGASDTKGLSLPVKAQKINTLLQEINLENEELNKLLPINNGFNIYNKGFLFKAALGDLGAYNSLLSGWNVLSEDIVMALVDEIIDIDDMS